MNNLEFAKKMQARTMSFAVNAVKFFAKLPRTDEPRVPGKQFLRAGTSVGANYRAVCRAKSDADFISKMGTVVEEADESAFWLELMENGGVCGSPAIQPLKAEVTFQGQVTYRVGEPKRLAALLNYTLARDGETYVSDNPEKLPERVIHVINVLARAELQKLPLREAIRASDELVKAVKARLVASEEITSLGLEVLGLSILAIKPTGAKQSAAQRRAVLHFRAGSRRFLRTDVHAVERGRIEVRNRPRAGALSSLGA